MLRKLHVTLIYIYDIISYGRDFRKFWNHSQFIWYLKCFKNVWQWTRYNRTGMTPNKRHRTTYTHALDWDINIRLNVALITVPPPCHNRRKVQLASGKRDMTSRLLSPLADDGRRFFALKNAKLLNNHCVLLGIIVCTNITGISSFQSCDLQHSACTHFGAKCTQSTFL